MATEPDKSELSEADKQNIIDTIMAKWVGPRTCPICTTDNWIIGSHLTTPVRLAAGGGMQIGGIVYPTAMIVCTNCGFVHHFNTVALKIPPIQNEADQASPAPTVKEVDNGR